LSSLNGILKLRFDLRLRFDHDGHACSLSPAILVEFDHVSGIVYVFTDADVIELRAWQDARRKDGRGTDPGE
jgi:hypothetical protein